MAVSSFLIMLFEADVLISPVQRLIETFIFARAKEIIGQILTLLLADAALLLHQVKELNLREAAARASLAGCGHAACFAARRFARTAE